MSKYGRGKVDVDAVKILRESVIDMDADINGSVTRGIHDIYGEVLYYSELLKFISKLERMDSPPIIFGPKARNGVYPLTKEGVELDSIVNKAILVSKHQEFYSLHPRLECLCNFVVKHDIAEMIGFGRISEEVRTKLTDKLKKLLSELKSFTLMQKGYDFMKGPLKNAASLRSYVDGLFKHHARLLVVRVDLSYKREFRDAIPLDEIIKHKDALLKDRRKGSLAKSWVGYACRLEHAPCTGYHYHLVVFLNGADFRGDVYHANCIIDEWRRITNDRGRGFNCNMKSDEYRFCGIGMINHFDREKRDNLKKVLGYLTKSDELAKLKLKGRRTFFKGTLPKKATNRGRKRSRGAPEAFQSILPLFTTNGMSSL